jgi:hypothetical protein
VLCRRRSCEPFELTRPPSRIRCAYARVLHRPPWSEWWTTPNSASRFQRSPSSGPGSQLHCSPQLSPGRSRPGGRRQQAPIRTVNFAVDSPCEGRPGRSAGVRRVPSRIRPAGDRVRHVTPRTAVFGGIRDTVVTPLALINLDGDATAGCHQGGADASPGAGGLRARGASVEADLAARPKSGHLELERHRSYWYRPGPRSAAALLFRPPLAQLREGPVGPSYTAAP